MKAQQAVISQTTFERPPPKSDDMRIEATVCALHGSFDQRVMPSLSGLPPIRTRCPACSDQATERTRLREEQHAAERRSQLVSALTGAAGVPSRFQDRTFGGYCADSRGQKHALALCEKFAENWQELRKSGTSLILTGGPGTGKTHLACAVANAVISDHLTSVRFVTVSELLRRIKETYRRDSALNESDVLKGFANCDLLIIDEIGVQVGSEHEKLLLFEVLNSRYQELRPTILISNMSADELETFLGHRVMDRFRESGAIVPFDWHSHRGCRTQK